MYSGAENRPMGSQGSGAVNQWDNDFLQRLPTSAKACLRSALDQWLPKRVIASCGVSRCHRSSATSLSSTAPFLLCPLSPLHCRSCLPHLGH
ncbi:hypothetical protein TNCT_106451 [Trichonephila clavata]|uniref:Uncharacterized protein n=1 Tax=Trichonephila clavata TaxID=2740835 RepID=A0A8X6LJB7_TRICU|nr:hypothetical protein TNCT_106451 [Trichonephila clavata]